MISNHFFASQKLMDLYRIHNHDDMAEAVDVLVDYYGGFSDSYSPGLELNGWIILRWSLSNAYTELLDGDIVL